MNGNPFYVSPAGDMTQGLSGIGDVLDKMAEQKAEKEKIEAKEQEQRARQAAVQKALTPGPDGSYNLDAINTTASQYPEMANLMYNGMNAGNEESQKRTLGRVRELANAPREQVVPTWDRLIEEGELAGHDMTDSRRERDAYAQDPETGHKGLTAAYAGLADPKEFNTWKEQNAPPEPYSNIAQLQRDLDNKLITPEQFTSEIMKENPAHASAVTKILSNGTVIQALSDKSIQVTGPEGTILEGPARTEALKKAAEEDLKFARELSGSRAAGAQSIEQSAKFFEQMIPVRRVIDNIDLAVKAIDDGANTGVIMSKLPSVRSSSIELDNIQKAMGLDVVGTSTFGALSKGELDLALDKALPTGLDQPELRKWLIDKKAAQEKLASYMEDAAVYLGIPGNTIPGFITEQKELAKLKQGSDGTPFVEMSDEDLLKGMDSTP